MSGDYSKLTKTRRNIMEVAESLFLQKGCAEVSIKQIATVAGVNVAQIFYYFPKKENLLEQLLSWRIRQMLEGIQEMADNSDIRVQDKLLLLMERYIDQGLANPLVLAQLFYENAITEHTNSRILLNDFKEQRDILIKTVIQQAQQQGALQPNADVMLLTGLLTGTIAYMIIHKDDYRECLHLQHLEEVAFNQELKHTLMNYLQGILQSTLIYE